MPGDGVDVGEEAAAWVSEFLQVEGCRMYHMSPHHKPRMLLDDDRWADSCLPGEEVGYFCSFCTIDTSMLCLCMCGLVVVLVWLLKCLSKLSYPNV